jgi:hypothetical protein
MSASTIANFLTSKENKMTAEHGKIEGDLMVESSFTLHGLVAGNITVRHPGVLRLRGMCSGNLVVEKEAEAYLYGTVGGDALNRGGSLRIYGIVGGRLETMENGDTFVHMNALIGSRSTGERAGDEDRV